MLKRAVFSVAIGAITAFSMVYIAWQHNPQCEFYCKDEIFFSRILILWFSWFIIGFLVVLSVLLAYRIFR